MTHITPEISQPQSEIEIITNQMRYYGKMAGELILSGFAVTNPAVQSYLLRQDATGYDLISARKRQANSS